MAEVVGKRRETQWAAQGLDTLEPAKALAVFQQLLGSNAPQVVAMPMDWQRFFRQYANNARPAFFDRIPDREAGPHPKRESFYRTLKAAPGDQQRDLLRVHIGSMVAGVLGLNPEEAVDTRQGFFQMGMDSLTSMELRNRLQKEFACTLAATLVFKYPTVESLADYLLGAVVNPAIGTAPDPTAENRAVTTETAGGGEGNTDIAALGELTEKEAEALLLEKLEKLRY